MLKIAVLVFAVCLAQASERIEGTLLLASAPYDAHALPPNTPSLSFLEEDELPWSAERQLSWEDFRGAPPENPGEEAAHIYLTLSITWRGVAWFDQAHGKWKARPIEIITNNIKNRCRSWVLPDHKTPKLIDHELADMAFQRALKTLKGQGRSAEEALRNLGKKLSSIFEEIRRKAEEVQTQYDRETEHGRNLEKQRRWDEKNFSLARRPNQNLEQC